MNLGKSLHLLVPLFPLMSGKGWIRLDYQAQILRGVLAPNPLAGRCPNTLEDLGLYASGCSAHLILNLRKQSFLMWLWQNPHSNGSEHMALTRLVVLSLHLLKEVCKLSVHSKCVFSALSVNLAAAPCLPHLIYAAHSPGLCCLNRSVPMESGTFASYCG